MKRNAEYKVINGKYVPVIRGGRVSIKFRDKSKYHRKQKHKQKYY